MRSILFLLILMVCISACKKSKPEKAGPDFMPLTTGSWWTYMPDMGGSYTLTVTDRDTVAFGRSYTILSSSTGIPTYLNRSANEYYRFGSLPGVLPEPFEELYLKDNQDVNASWQSNQVITLPNLPFPVVANLKYTIREKNITRNVSGRDYPDVIQVRLDVSLVNFGSVGGGDFYYADKVGLVESNILLTYMGQTVFSRNEKLIGFNIK